MAKESRGAVVKRRLFGLTMIVVVVALLGLSVAFYNKAFTPVTTVTLQTDSTGNQLQPQSDVKLRGIIVGEVRSVTANGEQADVELALDPSKTAMIPANVSALLLPKTLFGERYVALQLPSDPQPAIKAGDTIPQDRSAASIAVEQVLDDVLPVLQAVAPAELNATLNALVQALSGRGEQLGKNLVSLDGYLKTINTVQDGDTVTPVQNLLTDLDRLGQFSDIVDAAAPDLFASLTNLQTTSATITSRAAQLGALLVGGRTTADTLTGFLTANSARIISVSASSSQILALLARYSPEFPCLAAGLAKIEGPLDAAFSGQNGVGGLKLRLSVIGSRGSYVQGDTPAYGDIPGPDCAGLPNPDIPYPADVYGSGRGLDGAAATGDASSGAIPPAATTTAATSGDQAALQLASSRTESQTVNTLIAGSMHTTPDKVPGIATLLSAPVYRGTEVSSP